MITEHNGLEIETIANGPFVENCFIISEAASGEGILVDPGDEAEHILGRIRERKISIKKIVNTHAHIDHVGAVADIKNELGIPFALHAAESQWLDSLPMQAKMFGLPPKKIPTLDEELKAGDAIHFGNMTANVLHTPGHSAGGCCLYFANEGVVFVGDTLFAGSIGRTDLPGGALSVLLDSIGRELLALDDRVVVYCGHGEPTTIGRERKGNPFLQPGFAG